MIHLGWQMFDSSCSFAFPRKGVSFLHHSSACPGYGCVKTRQCNFSQQLHWVSIFTTCGSFGKQSQFFEDCSIIFVAWFDGDGAGELSFRLILAVFLWWPWLYCAGKHNNYFGEWCCNVLCGIAMTLWVPLLKVFISDRLVWCFHMGFWEIFIWAFLYTDFTFPNCVTKGTIKTACEHLVKLNTRIHSALAFPLVLCSLSGFCGIWGGSWKKQWIL